jgi:hypothetical protein
MSRSILALSALAMLLLFDPATSIAAEEEGPNPPTETAASPPEDISDQTLLGDFGGLRSALRLYGITFALSETSEVLGNVRVAAFAAVRSMKG